MNQNRSKNDKAIAVITGGTGGIGKVLCEKLADVGFQVCVADNNQENVDNVVSGLVEKGFSAFGIVAELTDKDSVKRLGMRARESGFVEVVVNNAGAASLPSFQAEGKDDWDSSLAINLTAARDVTMEFLPEMKAHRRGVVVNISSCNASGFFGNPAYSVAKAGLTHLTRMIAVEFGKFGIRAVTVSPGSVQTPAWERRQEENPNIFEDILQWYPLDRIVKPSEVANVVEFLVSDLASAITGSEIFVDCGLSSGNRKIATSISGFEI